MQLTELAQLFTQLGGEFVQPVEELARRAAGIKAVVFDWDGVFNNGSKGEGATSLFAEPDAAGTNYLRYGVFVAQGLMPFTAIITGEHNHSAFQLARREHFHAVCFRFPRKREAMRLLGEQFGVRPEETAFVFDDLLDLGLAQICGLRLMVRRSASPLLAHSVRQQGLCDYLTAHTGGQHAVREVCELFLGLTGVWEQVLSDRMSGAERYQTFVHHKKTATTRYFTYTDGRPVEQPPA
ncbi:MAG: phosphatase [Bernardetiaceae bacterium]|jgi:3-deoxy-D-manno-octulosonate 8-phosphate phosphatase (KDO 8-P phosphatase)|nr:phosphatase [Bernardetiaceae bacterium]